MLHVVQQLWNSWYPPPFPPPHRVKFMRKPMKSMQQRIENVVRMLRVEIAPCVFGCSKRCSSAVEAHMVPGVCAGRESVQPMCCACWVSICAVRLSLYQAVLVCNQSRHGFGGMRRM